MTIADTRLRRLIQKEIAKRSVNSDILFVHVTNGVVTLTGELRSIRGIRIDLKEEMALIEELIRRVPGVRDIVNMAKLLQL